MNHEETSHYYMWRYGLDMRELSPTHNFAMLLFGITFFFTYKELYYERRWNF